MNTQNVYRVKRKKGELPDWFIKELNHLIKKEGKEVTNPNHPLYKNDKVYLNKEEFSMYEFIKWVEWELTFNKWCYPDKEIKKLNDWFQMGLRWFRTTNPTGYMRLLD